jgi:hypothetical protein
MISDTLLERPGNGDVVELLEVAPIDPVFLTTGGGALLRHVRGRLRRERGEAEAGLEDLRATPPSNSVRLAARSASNCAIPRQSPMVANPPSSASTALPVKERS